jgi:hypothetical protein
MKRSTSPAELRQPHVVDRIVRDFTAAVLGMLGRPDFMARLDFECRRMNNLFLNVHTERQVSARSVEFAGAAW